MNEVKYVKLPNRSLRDENSLRELYDAKHSRICTAEFPEKDNEKGEKLSEESMATNF